MGDSNLENEAISNLESIKNNEENIFTSNIENEAISNLDSKKNENITSPTLKNETTSNLESNEDVSIPQSDLSKKRSMPELHPSESSEALDKSEITLSTSKKSKIDTFSAQSPGSNSSDILHENSKAETDELMSDKTNNHQFKLDTIEEDPKKPENISPVINGEKTEDNNANVKASDDQRQAIILKQIEYYFSYENMKHDIFFRKSMEENEGFNKGWLSMTVILNCPRIKKMNASQEEILESIKDSCNVFTKIDELNLAWLKPAKPLPPLEEKQIRSSQFRKKSPPDYHLAGCLIQISQIPSEVKSWSEVKTALQALLPQGASIKFATNLDSKMVCNMWVTSFPNDKSLLSSLQLELHGQKLQIIIMNDENEIKHFVNVQMPKRLKMQREKLISRTRSKLVQQPLKLADQTFNSVEHLRKCVTELLEKTPDDSFLPSNSAAEKVVKALINYHPNVILKNYVTDETFGGIKVLSPAIEENKKIEKRFAITSNMNDNPKETPFRLDKCIWFLSRDPPIVNDLPQTNPN